MALEDIAEVLFREGVNDPSPISRGIALGWYDGPTEGLLQLGEGGPVFRFQMIADDKGRSPAELDPRVFRLYPLPSGAVDRVVDLLASTNTPCWPVWLPVWQFPTEEIRSAVERGANDVIASAGALSWVVVGDMGTEPVRSLLVELARAS